jgi:glucan 1,3-beta-glucosidase
MALYQIFNGGSNINAYGGGFWTFYNGHVSCTSDCQSYGVRVSGTSHLTYFGINTRFISGIVLNNGVSLVQSYWNPGGWGAVVAAFLTDS